MCGSGRLETSCHSRAMMAGSSKTGRGRFAEKTAKRPEWSDAISVLGHTRADGARIISVALNRLSRLGDKRTTL